MRAIAIPSLTRMETLMGAVFRSIFSFIVTFFATLEKVTKSAENLADVAQETSAQYKDQAILDRQLAAQEAELERIKRKAKIDQAKAKAQAQAQQQQQP